METLPPISPGRWVLRLLQGAEGHSLATVREDLVRARDMYTSLGHTEEEMRRAYGALLDTMVRRDYEVPVLFSKVLPRCLAFLDEALLLEGEEQERYMEERFGRESFPGNVHAMGVLAPLKHTMDPRRFQILCVVIGTFAGWRRIS